MSEIVKNMIWTDKEKRLNSQEVYNQVMNKFYDKNDILKENRFLRKRNSDLERKIQELEEKIENKNVNE